MINICCLSWPIFCWNPAYNREVLFSDHWWGIRVGVLNYDTFFNREELQNSGKAFYGKWTWDYHIPCLKMPVAQPGQCFILLTNPKTKSTGPRLPIVLEPASHHTLVFCSRFSTNDSWCNLAIHSFKSDKAHEN